MEKHDKILQYPIVCKAPGRINIIGEHTDYNGGFVLPAAINKYITIGLRLNDTASTVEMEALDIPAFFEFDLKDKFKPDANWYNYLIGVCKELQKAGHKLKGFDCCIYGDIPSGSGMSSSAALECALAFGLNELFDLKLSRLELAKIAQKAEHNYVGTQCGIMDQFASMIGEKNQFMLLDCQSLSYKHFSIDTGDYEILLLNTNVSHNLASSEYNTRRSECEQGVEIIASNLENIHQLRDVELLQLNSFKDQLPPRVYNRCRYIIEENDRVLDAVEAIAEGNLKRLGRLLYQSHEGLSTLYEVSCAELDYLVDYCHTKSYVLGARMMGGGFGGCVILFIDKAEKEPFISEISNAYFKHFNLKLSPYSVSIETGATRIK